MTFIRKLLGSREFIGTNLLFGCLCKSALKMVFHMIFWKGSCHDFLWLFRVSWLLFCKFFDICRIVVSKVWFSGTRKGWFLERISGEGINYTKIVVKADIWGGVWDFATITVLPVKKRTNSVTRGSKIQIFTQTEV